MTSVPITVNSTSDDYFVLYIQIDNVISVSERPGTTGLLPISVTMGEDGTTTLTDNLAPLNADRYRVEKYPVAQPGDIDGDCVDDLTELADPATYNPINPATSIDRTNGAITIDSLETFQELSFNGEPVFADLRAFRNLEFIKFIILNAETDNPITYFINTNTTQSHSSFAYANGLQYESVFTKGQIVYHPNVPSHDGSPGVYRFEFPRFEDGDVRNIAKYNEILAAAMPFLENSLYYYPATTAQARVYQQQKARFDASRINVLRHEDIAADVDFIALNQAEGYGRLRLMEEGDRPSIYDVAIYTTLPNDLPRVAGTITTVPQTPLSHVNLRAIQNGLPNAFIRDALNNDAITALLGSYVYYAVTADGYTIRAATKAEVDAHHEARRPAATQTLQRDLTVTDITALADVSFGDWTAFGVKAANVAELATLPLPAGTTPVGFAVPFYFYDSFMTQATVAKQTILGKKKAPDEEKITLAAGTTLAQAVTQMLAHPYFQSDAAIQEEMLDDLRDAIKDATSPAFIIEALTAMHAAYPEGQSLRYRSSTNNEDLPSFNGAGLYSSKTQDPDETASDGIDKSIKAVWASLWNYRAFVERDFQRVDHATVAMGVLVHPNYSDERVNGVAVSYDPITFQDGAYYLNSQVGEDLVTNPQAHSQPEQLLLGSTGASTVLSRSSLATTDALLMTDAQLLQLRRHLETIHDHFKTLYGVQDGDDYAVEIEFKITAGDRLAIKQARPWIFAEPLELARPTATIAMSSARVTERAGLELTVTRSGGVMSRPLTVDLSWSETGAMLEAATPASVTIPGHQTSATVTVPIDDDRDDEQDSVVTASIAASSGYITGTPSSASATVTDDDLTRISVRAEAGTVTEGSTVDLTFTRSGSVLEQPLIVDITVSESGSRLTGAVPTEVTFAATSATSRVSLPTADDEVITSSSVVTVEIDAGIGYGIEGAGLARVTVVEDEVPGPTLLFPADHAVSEGAVLVVSLDISRHHGQGVSFSMDGPDTGAFILYGSVGLLLFEEQDADPPGDANQDGVYEIDLTAENSAGGATTARLRVTVTTAELISLAAQQWDQASEDQRSALLPDLPTSRLQPAFADLRTDVQAMVLRLARQQQLPSPGPTVRITAGADITEGGDATFTITADPAPAADLDVTVSVSQSGDFDVPVGARTVTIPATGSAVLTVSTSNDVVDEADGSVTAALIRGAGYIVPATAGSATVAVADDDVSATAEVSITGSNGITEGGDATFTVTASPAPHAPLVVSVSVAQAGDYGVAPGARTVTIPTTGSATLAVATSDDSADEADGSVTVTVDTGPGYTVSATAGAASVAVRDDEVPPPPQASPVVSIVGGSGVTEGDSATFTLTADPAPSAPLAVSVGVAQTGDYGVNTSARSVTIPATGSTTLTVATSNDSADETDGSVTATVRSGQGYVVSGTEGAATVTVADDDPAAAACDPQVKSDGVDRARAAFAWHLSYGTNAPLFWRILQTLGAEEMPAKPAGVTVEAITVREVTDFSADRNWPGWAPIVDAMEACLAPPPASPVVSITGGSTVTEGGVASFTLTADPVPASALTVNVNVTQDGDFGATGPRTVTVPATGTVTLTISTMGDEVEEGDGSVTATVDAGSGYTVSTTAGSASVTIEDDDGGACIPNLPDDAITVSEVETWRDEFTHAEHVQRWNRVLAALGEDTGKEPMTADDARAIKQRIDNTRWDRTVRTLTAMEECSAQPPAQPEVSIAGGSSVTEGGTATFTLTANPPPASPLNVAVAVSQSGDFGVTLRAQTVTIPTSGTYTLGVATSDDSVDESDGLVTVTVNSGTGYDVSSSNGVATVAVSDDDDPPPPTPEVSITVGAGVTEGGSATFTVTASPAPTSPLAVTVAVTQSGDFGVPTGSRTVTIPTSGSYTLSVATSNDSVDESDGSVTVTVNSGTGYDVSSSNGFATVAVSDDDDPPPPPTVNATPSLSISDASGNEGDTVEFTVTLSPSSSRYVWVHYYARPAYGAAASATFADFGSVYGTLTFKPGETSKTITVNLIDDSEPEGNETFVFSLYDAVQAKVSDSDAVGTIIDND